MGVGKSTTGRALATQLDWPYADSDEEIERLAGQSGRSLAADVGVPRLHELEAALLLGALARPVPHVIAAAASVVEKALVQRMLPGAAFVVRLTAPVDVIVDRQADGGHRRPMAFDELAAIEARRGPLFAAVEDLVLDAERSTEDLVAAIVGAMAARGLVAP